MFNKKNKLFDQNIKKSKIIKKKIDFKKKIIF